MVKLTLVGILLIIFITYLKLSALSRAKSLKGLQLLDFDQRAVRHVYVHTNGVKIIFRTSQSVIKFHLELKQKNILRGLKQKSNNNNSKEFENTCIEAAIKQIETELNSAFTQAIFAHSTIAILMIFFNRSNWMHCQIDYTTSNIF
jgi:hypothetical protein